MIRGEGMRERNLALVVAALIGLCAAAQADEPMYFAPGGIAMSGYDPVAYFTQGSPVEGTAEHSIVWRGATWYFVSSESQMFFEMNPLAYAPQFGGYCVYAVAEGHTAPTAPDAFFVRDGRLYFMHTATMVHQNQAKLGRIVAEAQDNWPAALGARP